MELADSETPYPDTVILKSLSSHCHSTESDTENAGNPACYRLFPMRTGFQRLQGSDVTASCSILQGNTVQVASDCAYMSVRQAYVKLLGPVDDARSYICQSAETSAGRKYSGELPDQEFPPDVKCFIKLSQKMKCSSYLQECIG